MRISVVTIFPSMFQGFLSEGIVGRAVARGLVDVKLLNLREFTTDNYRTVDDYPYGGGPGMVMKAEPILRAVGAVTGRDYLTPGVGGGTEGVEPAGSARSSSGSVGKDEATGPSPAAGEGEAAPGGTDDHRIILLSPQGKRFSQALASELSSDTSVVLICGRYKSVDERVGEILGAEEVSVGDYVLSGGELAAMVMIESVVRLLPGAMEDEDSAAGDSFAEGLLDSAYFTRPEVVAGRRVPEVLVSGNHEAIRKWRRKSSLDRTRERRPDLLEGRCLSDEESKPSKKT